MFVCHDEKTFLINIYVHIATVSFYLHYNYEIISGTYLLRQ